jgi:two-component system chemotaxis response regulator CheB
MDVLVVDDSAVVRQLVAALLGAQPGVSVRAVPDAVHALREIAARAPDVVVLDLEMPRMHGLDFLRDVMRRAPLPVVVFAGLSARGSARAVDALLAGAVEVIPKPADAREGFASAAVHLVRAVREAARARPARAAASREHRPAFPAAGAREADAVVVVGASAGGPQALHALLPALPGEAPGIVVAQHIPAAYVAALAKGLAAAAPRLEVREAADGDRVAPGRVLLAPGGRRTTLLRSGTGWRVRVEPTSAPGPHPSVDALFHSAAESAGRRAVGVLLTGMGSDGARGLLALREAGASTVVQDEATSVVWGMPAAASALDAATETLPLPRIPDAIVRLARRATEHARA